MLKVYLKKQRKKRLEQGHPWIYQSEIERIEGDVGEDDLIS
ncbi:MAG: rRNA large subunit methyltransferase I, partial [Desulfitobacteriaceae bacterium]|nr:rRNA large subunit methyltransferase I [Desulfitobacteriaceae bacterium]